MIAKDLTPGNGAKAFAIMKTAPGEARRGTYREAPVYRESRALPAATVAAGSATVPP